MSIVLQNLCRMPRARGSSRCTRSSTGGHTQIMEQDGFAVSLSNIQILIMLTTVL